MPEAPSVADHPCFSADAHFRCGRVHLAVAPGCNIQCAYCTRKCDCPNESRPGVTSRVLSPAEALAHLTKALRRVPHTKVVGIAGPGEPLFNDATFETLRLVGKAFPQLLLCVSTNGLLLIERMEDLVSCKVNTLTVTVNTLNTNTARIIYPDMGDHEAFLRSQQEGVALAVRRGMTVKINMVLIPGVNDAEVPQVARFAADAGAAIMNIIPMISMGDMAHLEPPAPVMVEEARRTGGMFLPQFTHCKRCRADAVGIPGRI